MVTANQLILWQSHQLQRPTKARYLLQRNVWRVEFWIDV